MPRILDAVDEDTKEAIPGTPTDNSEILHPDINDSAHKTNGNIYSSGKMSKLVTPFGKRSNKFVVKFNIDNLPATDSVISIYDPENLEDDIIKRIQPRKSCLLVVHRSGPEPGCRFMYDRIEDRVSDSFCSISHLLFLSAICILLKCHFIGTVQCT